MNKAIYYKYMFIIAGLWEILLVFVFGIFSPIVDSFLPFFGLVKDPIIYFWLYSFLLLLAINGFEYILVGMDITKNHLVVSTSMISKSAFFIILVIFFILDKIQWPMFIFGVIELVIVALFIEFYVNYKNLETSQIVEAYSYKNNP